MSPLAVLAGLLVTLAVAVALLPARRDPPRRGRGAGGTRDSRPGGRGRGWCGWVLRRGVPVQEDVDVAVLLVRVAALLRSGASPAAAWASSLEAVGVGGPSGGLGSRRRAPGNRSGPAAQDSPGAPDGCEDPDSPAGADGVPPVLLALARQPPPGWGRTVAPLPGWRLTRAQWRQAAVAARGAVAACRLTAHLGAPLAQVLESVADGVAEAARAEASRASALAGPRATARLLAALPLVALAVGAGVGTDPAAVLLDGGAGTALGAAGCVLTAAGILLTHRMVAAAQAGTAGVDEAVVADLAVAALEAGASVPGALEALGQALEEDELTVVGRCLLLGAQWEEAWQAPADARWRAGRRHVEQCLRPGWEDGAQTVSLLRQQASSLRARRSARDEEAAQRLAVRLVLPLGLCHLPAFVCLGVLPVVIGLGRGWM